MMFFERRDGCGDEAIAVEDGNAHQASGHRPGSATFLSR